jgi:hypothetical protein
LPTAIVPATLGSTLAVTAVAVAAARVAAAVGAVSVARVTGISRHHGDGGTADQQERGKRPSTGDGAKLRSGHSPFPTDGETAHLRHSVTAA